MRGLYRATNYYNRIEAWRDWEKLLKTAGNVPVCQIAKIAQKPTAGWRTIDKSIAKLREAIKENASA